MRRIYMVGTAATPLQPYCEQPTVGLTKFGATTPAVAGILDRLGTSVEGPLLFADAVIAVYQKPNS